MNTLLRKLHVWIEHHMRKESSFSWTTFIYSICKEYNLNSEDLIDKKQLYSEIKNTTKATLIMHILNETITTNSPYIL